MSCQPERQAGWQYRGQTDKQSGEGGKKRRRSRRTRCIYRESTQTGGQTDRKQTEPASVSPVMSPLELRNTWRILRWCNLLKAGALSGPACSHGANYDGGINTVLMLGIDTVWGYNYAWHGVMRGLKTDPQTERRSQPPSLLRETHEFKGATAWLSTVFWRLRGKIALK